MLDRKYIKSTHFVCFLWLVCFLRISQGENGDSVLTIYGCDNRVP